MSGCIHLNAEEGRALMASIDAAKTKRAAAIRTMFSAFDRLRELGWRDAMYAPRDGSPLELVECGSTGVHRGYRDEHGFWIVDGDVWPSSPVLFRTPRPSGAAARDASAGGSDA